ncbi:DUF5960 family protein [Streptococcus panodentis]|uniref:Uncharacterized protein n=1 Tax=Streptococcus panodentis TaxID=1581472 RepID=A0ABS5AY83_9STRE|nr:MULTISPECIES: DUF5960 family protein [Streptococcus]KXT81498.1 hypothetical protein STRDD11_02019 [Streptococcus sp. DD11]MBP2621535.1 hypothetical protein [Streptococcus panodentis]
MTAQFSSNELQFDYFSDNYRQFQQDFYRFSNLSQPLSFMEEDLLLHMAGRQSSYFKLSKSKSLDQKDHYFHFSISSPADTPCLKIYHYQGQSEQIAK